MHVSSNFFSREHTNLAVPVLTCKHVCGSLLIFQPNHKNVIVRTIGDIFCHLVCSCDVADDMKRVITYIEVCAHFSVLWVLVKSWFMELSVVFLVFKPNVSTPWMWVRESLWPVSFERLYNIVSIYVFLLLISSTWGKIRFYQLFVCQFMLAYSNGLFKVVIWLLMKND